METFYSFTLIKFKGLILGRNKDLNQEYELSNNVEKLQI